MKNNIEKLTSEILKIVELQANNTKAEFLNLVPIYTIEKLSQSQKFSTIYTKMKNIQVILLDYIRLTNVITQLNWVEMTSEVENFQNPYGLFFTIKEMYYDPKFFNLPIEDQINILLVEIFNTYSEKGKDYESFLMLCHFKFFNYKPIYSQSKRSKLIELAKLDSVKLPILFSKSTKAKKFMRKYIIDNSIDIKYNTFTKYAGWSVINLSKEFKTQHFNQLIIEG